MNIHGVQAYIQADRVIRNTNNRAAQQQQQQKEAEQNKLNENNKHTQQFDSHQVFTRNGRTTESYAPKGTLFDKVG
ncbi:MAG: hypothetical protein JNJ85_03390 [Candidatus Kapabacteria bacterium]|nr:hypothetical protein [Candidatus Kapabacteria bacterium]